MNFKGKWYFTHGIDDPPKRGIVWAYYFKFHKARYGISLQRPGPHPGRFGTATPRGTAAKLGT
jgi:hypothetical protein